MLQTCVRDDSAGVQLKASALLVPYLVSFTLGLTVQDGSLRQWQVTT